MESWNRKELYNEVWEKPLVKVAPKYGISAVALGKVCHKLQIPLPGRGYWVKKEFGKAVEKLPLPEAKGLPFVQRLKFPSPQSPTPLSSIRPEPPPTDPEFLRISEFESRNFAMDPRAKQHKLVKEAERILRHQKADERGIRRSPYDQACLDVRVSKGMLERALAFMNGLLLSLKSEGFPTTVQPGNHGTGAQVFGHRILFEIVEKVREVGRRQVHEYSWTRTLVDYEPCGELEFRFGDCGYRRKRYRDGKKQQLESLVQTSVGSLMREGRACIISAGQEEQRKIERAAKERERASLAAQIAEEKKKIKDLEMWVSSWAQAQQMRDFIAALEKVWIQEGHDLSAEAQKGQRIIWMKQQADRLDPMLPSPPSITDRKNELSPYW